MSRTMMADVTRFTLTSTHMALFRVWNCSAFAPQSGGDSSQCTRERKNSEACTLPGRLVNAECEWEHEVSCERCSCSPSKFMKSKIVSCAVLRGARRHFDNEIYHLESFAKCLHVSLLLSALTSRPVEKKNEILLRLLNRKFIFSASCWSLRETGNWCSPTEHNFISDERLVKLMKW